MVTLVVSDVLVEPLLPNRDDLFGATTDMFELSGGGGGGGAIEALLTTLLELRKRKRIQRYRYRYLPRLLISQAKLLMDFERLNNALVPYLLLNGFWCGCCCCCCLNA